LNKRKDWTKPDRLVLVEGWRREGMSEEAIAARIGISPGTLRSWARQSPMLAMALETNRESTDAQVESALLKKALGYESQERKVETNAKGELKEVVTTKQVGPDMSAISMWLKKRRPEKWGDEAVSGPKPENNLMEELEGELDTDAIPELQPEAESGADLVAQK
jgi:transposase-like protein